MIIKAQNSALQKKVNSRKLSSKWIPIQKEHSHNSELYQAPASHRSAGRVQQTVAEVCTCVHCQACERRGAGGWEGVEGGGESGFLCHGTSLCSTAIPLVSKQMEEGRREGGERRKNGYGEGERKDTQGWVRLWHWKLLEQ